MKPSSRRPSTRCGVVAASGDPDQPPHRLGEPAIGQAGHGAVVEDAEPARAAVVGGDHPEVPGVRVGVEHAGARRPGEEEPHEQLAVVISLLLAAAVDHRRERGRALEPLGDQHLAPDGDHVGDDDVGIVAERLGEGALGLRLEGVVELVGGPRLELLDQRLHLDARDQRPDRAGEPGELSEIGVQGLPGAGVLHLDRDLTPVAPAAAVHLADAGGGRRPAVEPDQVVLPGRAEVERDLVADRLGRHRGSGVLEPGELRAVRRGELVGEGGLEHRHRLPELHRPALELAQGAEQLLGGPLLDLAHHGLGRLAAEALAEPDRVAAGVPERQRRESRRTRDRLAWKLGHALIVPDERSGT